MDTRVLRAIGSSIASWLRSVSDWRIMVQDHHPIASSHIARANGGSNDVCHKRPMFSVGSWVWEYNDLTVLQKGRDKDDERVLK